MRRRFETIQLRDSIPEIVFLNSHDGTSAYQLRVGLYRVICTNGLIVSQGAFPMVRVHHRGDVVDAVISGALEMAERFELLAHADGRVYIGGFQFSSVNGTTGLNILARVSASSGAVDAGWNAGLVSTAYIETLAVESNTRLLAAGNAVRPGGGAVARYRLDGGSVVDGAFAPIVNGFGIGVMYDPVAAAVVLTGSFSLAENEPRSGLAAFQADYEAVFGDGFED